MRYWLLSLNLVGVFISTRPSWSGGNVLYHSCTSFEGASRGGQPLNIFEWFIGAGGIRMYSNFMCIRIILTFWVFAFSSHRWVFAFLVYDDVVQQYIYVRIYMYVYSYIYWHFWSLLFRLIVGSLLFCFMMTSYNNVCTYVCIHMYVYSYIYWHFWSLLFRLIGSSLFGSMVMSSNKIYTYIYTYVCVFIYMLTCSRLWCWFGLSLPVASHRWVLFEFVLGRHHATIYTCIYVCIHVCICIYIYTYIYIHTHTYTHTHIQTSIYIYTYICTHMHTHTHTHTHTTPQHTATLCHTL